MQKVELHAAFMFDCPSCGRENFCRALSPSFDKEEYDSICQTEGLENDGTWNFIVNPTSVTCAYCQQELLVEDPE